MLKFVAQQYQMQRKYFSHIKEKYLLIQTTVTIGNLAQLCTIIVLDLLAFAKINYDHDKNIFTRKILLREFEERTNWTFP